MASPSEGVKYCARAQSEVKFAPRHLRSKLHYVVTSLRQQLHLPARANLTAKSTCGSRCFLLEQDTGVEPAFTAWEAVVLPIYESCIGMYLQLTGAIIADPKVKFNHNLSMG